MPETTDRVESSAPELDLDAVIIGAGFGGLYALHRLRQLGLSLRVYDEAGGVGGTWWWNRYPGARVDFPGGPFYCYTFSDELIEEWDWTETQPDQPAVLAYLNRVADKFDLRRDIQLRTKVLSAEYDEATSRWHVETSNGERVSAQYLVSAVGTLSAPHMPYIPGIDHFAGDVYHTGHWPQDEDVDFAGKRVGVIGTGSSGIQIVPILAARADHLTILQRTPQFSLPGRNRALPPEVVRDSKENWPEMRQRLVEYGRPFPPAPRSALEDSEEERLRVYEAAWQKGGMAVRDSYNDLLTDREANRTVSDFMRSKISEIVHDAEIARKLMPDYYFGTKRQVMDEGYYETFNRDNVTLVDLREEPIETFTADGVRTAKADYPLDLLVLATGFDAMTGALRRLNPVGLNGQRLADKWAEGARTYLGMSIVGFPNLFMIHGPETPSVMFHMPLGAELQGNWIAECIEHMRENGLSSVEPTREAETAWGAEVREIADRTLYPLTDSWFTGANIPGKPREFAIYLGGAQYHRRLREVAENGYGGLTFAR